MNTMSIDQEIATSVRRRYEIRREGIWEGAVADLMNALGLDWDEAEGLLKEAEG